jgi:uncharacterized protein YijF (DUF1287 family)/plasmid stability protein
LGAQDIESYTSYWKSIAGRDVKTPRKSNFRDGIRQRLERAVPMFVHAVRVELDEARSFLRDCLPVKAAQRPAALNLSAPWYLVLSDRFERAVAGARSAADEARTLLRDCLPIKSLPEPAADDERPFASQALSSSWLLGISDRFGAAFARTRSAADEARTLLRDCLPVKSLPEPAAGDARPFASQALSPSWHLGISDRFEATFARACSAADEVRTVLRDCLPVKIASRPAADHLRPLALPRLSLPALRLPYSADEREAIALLFLPFLLVASAMLIYHSARRVPLVDIAAVSHEAPAPSQVSEQGVPLGAVDAGPALRPVTAPADVPALPPANIGEVGTSDAAQAPVVETPPKIAMLEAPDAEPQIALPAEERGVCLKTAALSSSQAAPSIVPPPSEFGLRLAQAAEAQVDGFVIYNDKYRSISYPMGDVPPLFGVCTDVVVRAYRALGLDLQELVHEAKSGSGDKNIDHRRTEVLRRFFAARGESLPITAYAEDYLPGDIVTYYRPQNRHNRSHIAIVSAMVAPSGRPMIIHNRGWGPQVEDALFVDQITGHYRYYGPSTKQDIERASADGPSGKTAVPGHDSAVTPIAFAPRRPAANP